MQMAPNCSAICQRGCMWGFCSPTGNILLNTTLHPSSIFFCSTANIFLTSASFKGRCSKKLACIFSITCPFQETNIIRHAGGEIMFHYLLSKDNFSHSQGGSKRAIFKSLIQINLEQRRPRKAKLPSTAGEINISKKKKRQVKKRSLCS